MHHGQFNQFHIFKEVTICNAQNVITICHILVKGLMLKGEARHVTTFDFIVNLNMPTLLAIMVTSIQDLRHKGLHPSTN
jgi:hypothetical protein